LNMYKDKIYGEKWELVIINFYQRSGSYLFHSFLDNHPNLIVLPNFFRFCNFNRADMVALCPGKYTNKIKSYIPIKVRKAIKSFILNNKNTKNDSSKNDICINKYETLSFWMQYYDYLVSSISGDMHPNNKPYCMLGNPRRVYQLDKNSLMSILKKIWTPEEKISLKFFIRGFLVAYAELVNDKLLTNKKNIVIYQQHQENEVEFNLLKSIFDDVKKIITIREPLIAYSSAFKLKENPLLEPEGFDCYRGILNNFNELLFGGQRYSGMAREDSVAVKFEDIRENTRDTMNKIAIFLNIPWNDVLCIPTMLGEAWWWPTSTEGDFVSGINNKARTDIEHSILTDNDCNKLIYLMEKRYLAYGYNYNKFNIKDIKIESLAKFDFPEKLIGNPVIATLVNKKLINMAKSFYIKNNIIDYILPL